LAILMYFGGKFGDFCVFFRTFCDVWGWYNIVF